MRLTFEVPAPLSLNHAYENMHWGRRLSDRGKAYKDAVGWATREAAAAAGWEDVAGTLYAFTLDVWFPDRRKADIDNKIKLTMDSVCEALGFDDSLVVDIRVRRLGIDRVRPRGEVTIEAVSGLPVQEGLLCD